MHADKRMTSESLESKIALTLFDGEREIFQLWWVHFEECGLLKGFRMTLSKTREVDLPRDGRVKIDATTDDRNRAKKAFARNNLVIANMGMAFATSGIANKVCNSRIVEWLGGLSYLLVQDLLKE